MVRGTVSRAQWPSTRVSQMRLPGIKGLQTARQSSGIVADALGCPAQEVLVASTGVIGQHLQMEPFESGAPLAVSALSPAGGADAARAIMTTDTKPKNSP